MHSNTVTMLKAFAFGAVFAAAATAVFGQTAEPDAQAILARMDEQREFSTLSYEGTMEIYSGSSKRVKTLRSIVSGDGKAMAEFTNPEDRGTRFLKVGKDLWMYFPKEDDTVRISGHLLKEGMMGSDLSYEDALESDLLSADYAATVLEKAEYEGRPVFVVELKAARKEAKWDRRILWVDAERYVTLKEELWTRGGVLLRVTKVLAVEKVGARWVATAVEVRNMLKKDSRTVFVISKIVYDKAVDPAVFTLDYIKK